MARTKRIANMKELSVTITAVCTMPVDFQLKPDNYHRFEVVYHGAETPRQMSLKNVQVRVKDLFFEPAVEQITTPLFTPESGKETST